MSDVNSKKFFDQKHDFVGFWFKSDKGLTKKMSHFSKIGQFSWIKCN